MHEVFDEEDDTFTFQRDLKRLGAVIMPLARAIQCLEAKETTAADVYTYWLAVVAHLQDLMVKDRSKYNDDLKKTIRQVINSRFSSLIESKTSSNIYLTAFVLDPGSWLITPPFPTISQ